jgi:YD repeat-containing protein
LGHGLPTITITDENNHSTVQTWLPFGSPDDARLAMVTDAAGNMWSYGYDVAGQLTSVVAPDGTTRSWSYDANFLLGSETHPESGTTTYTYDLAGVLKTKTDANGTVFTYGYDGNDRVRSITTSDNQVTRITYEPGSDNRQTLSNSSTASTFIYDPAGRLQIRQDVIDGWGFSSQYEYDANDNLRAIIYPTGRRIFYDLNAAHQITQVAEPAAGRTYAQTMTYHPSGALATYTAGNGITTTIGYDPKRYWVTSIDSGNLHLSYSDYDKVGNVKTITDSRPGANQTSQTFTYDVLDRLWTLNGPYGSATYTYDAHGNRLNDTNSTFTYQPGTLRLASQAGTSFTYDYNGNTRSAGTALYSYTPQNMLQSATVSGATTLYTYDGDDSRAKKSTNGSLTYFLRGASGELLTEWTNPGSGNGSTRDYVYAGSRLLSAVVKTAASDPATACGTIAGDGSLVNVTVAPGQNPCFKFYGHANQRVSALMKAVSPSTFGNSWYLRLLRPNQSELTYAFTCCGYDADFLDTVSLPEDGDYTLVVDPAATLTGSVSLQLYAIGDVTGSIAADGTPVNVALTTPGQRGVLTFTATAGQTLSATMTALSPTWFPQFLDADAGRADRADGGESG